MAGTKFRDELTEPTAREFDALYAWLRNMFGVSFNEDGSLRASALTNAYDPTNSSSLPPTGLLQPGILPPLASVRDEEHWWRNGPWTFDDPNSRTQHLVGLRPPGSPAGTYHNYAPAGIDRAVIIELEPAGNITLTGIKAPSPTRKRMLFLRNRDSTYSVTLTHGSTSSIRPNRFSLPSSTSVVLGPGQNIWLYYDLGRAAWTSLVTKHDAGGLGLITSAGTRVLKTSDETIQSSSTLHDDSELTFQMVTGVRYRIRMNLFFNSHTTADFKWSTTVPSTTRYQLTWVFISQIGGTAEDTHSSVVTTNHSTNETGAEHLSADLLVEPSASGTFALSWAQQTSQAQNTTVYRGSSLEYLTW